MGVIKTFNANGLDHATYIKPNDNQMKSHFYKFLLAGTLLTSGNIYAQTAIQANRNVSKITLVQAVEIALQNNISVKQSQIQVQNNDLLLRQAKFNRLPSASSNISESFSFGRSLNPFTNSYDSQNINYNNIGVNASVILFNGNLLKNNIIQNDINLKASQLDLQAMKESISLQVVLAYLNILSAEDQLTIAQSQTEITKLQIERTTKLVNAGSLPQSNVLDLKAQLANEETTVVNNQTVLDLNKLSLIQLLNDKSITDVQPERISVPIPNSQGYDASISQIYDVAQSNQPVVKAADLRIMSAAKGIDIARAGLLPILSLNGSISANQSNAQKSTRIDGTKDNYLGDVTFQGQTIPLVIKQPNYVSGETIGYFDQLNNTQNKVFGLNLNIPIFSKFQNKTRIAQANLQKINAEFEAQKTRLTLRQNIEQAYVNMTNAAKRFDALTVQVQALEESFRAADSKFNAGAIDYVSYSLQKTNLDKARANQVQAKYDFVFRTKILDYYQNKPLTF